MDNSPIGMKCNTVYSSDYLCPEPSCYDAIPLSHSEADETRNSVRLVLLTYH